MSQRKPDLKFAAACRRLAEAIANKRCHDIGPTPCVDFGVWECFGITAWWWPEPGEPENQIDTGPKGRDHRVMFLLMVAEAEENP